MKLTVVTVKQFTLVNLNGLENCIRMNTTDLSGIVIVIGMKLRNIVGKQITTLTGIRIKLLIGKQVSSYKNQRNHTFFEESLSH